MPIDAKCPGCGQLLRVDDAHAGKHAACPSCRTVYLVPSGGEAAPARPEEPMEGRAPALAADDGGAWFMKTPEGHVYGPVTPRELDRWAVEGRIGADCQVRLGQNGSWIPADEHYPRLKPRPATPRVRSPADASSQPTAGSAANLYAGPPPPTGGKFFVPHRGLVVLLTGILGWAMMCPVFGLIAWIIGTSDLREMREGRMNQAGARLTKIGRILGIISTLLWIALMVVGSVLLAVAAAIGAFA